MFESKVNLAVSGLAVVGAVGLLLGIFSDDRLIGVIVSVAGFGGAALLWAYSAGRTSITDKQRTDEYERTKAACIKARRQIENEWGHLTHWVHNRERVIGREYAETTPFELIRDRMTPLLHDPQYGSLASQVSEECELLLETPVETRDVRRLMAILVELREKIDRWLGPEA